MVDLTCRRKEKHKSKGKAEATLRSLFERFPNERGKMNVYLCVNCKQWHVGHIRGIRSK